MAGIPQTIRFTIDDKYDYAQFKSRLNNKTISAINDSANEAARRINSNADLNTTRELIGIENAAHEIAESQIAAAYIIESSIQASTNRIVAGQNMIADSIDDLRSLFDTRSAEIIWQLEQQRKELNVLLERIYKAILETDKNKARAKKEDGIKAYNNKWFDEAIKDFDDSIKSYSYDFQVYQFLGNIYLFEKGDPKKAIENYNLAVRYAEPYSDYYTSLAFLHVGLSNYDMGNYQDAYNAASNSIQKNPKFSEAYYRRAQYSSKLGKHDEAINNLRIAIKTDRGYCLKALAEKDFEPMSSKLKDLIGELTEEEKGKADQEIDKSNELIKKFEYIGVPNDAREKLDEGINLKRVGNYLSYRDAIYKAKVSQKIIVDLLFSKLSSEKSKLESQFNELKEKFNRVNPHLNRYILYMKVSFPFFLLGIIGIMVIIAELFVDFNHSPLIFRLYLFYDHEINNSDNFIAHSIGQLIILSIFFTPISIPLFLHSLHKYITLSPQKISSKELDYLNKRIAENHQNLEMIEFEKSDLNIDRDAERLDYKQYEKYLLKNYG